MGLKEKMADKWFENMNPKERQEMMKKFMSGQEFPMAGMMGRMMGCGGEGEEGNAPWDMCRKMMATIGRASDLATFATPEVRGLFEEWAAQIEEEILHFVQESKSTNADEIAAHFKLSRDSANYFLSRLSRQGKISLKAEKTVDKKE